MFRNEKIIETKTCKQCNASFEITNKDVEFYEKVSPVFQGKKYIIPSPTFCPDCRQQRRLSFRNERKLYKRKCDATGKEIISIYSPDKLYKVYEQNYWWSDNWNPLDYGINFDFNKSFFKQFEELIKEVPRCALEASDNENSNFTNHSARLKDCYLIFDAGFDKNCYYSAMISYSNDCIDCLKIDNSEVCYECVDCKGCYNLIYSVRNNDCRKSYFLYNCSNCEYCFGCVNLNNKKYYIFNKEFSKEKYFEELNNLLRKGIYNEELKKEVRNHIIRLPFKENYIISSENCSGNNIYSSMNAISCFDVSDVNDVKYSQALHKAQNCMDVTVWGGNASNICECMSIGPNSSNLLFCFLSYPESNNLIYCGNCMNGIKNCFGCIGLKNNKQYCILNKQYTKEEYETLVLKIIEHMMTTKEWGEFFPSSISPFGYNETVAMEYFPISRDKALPYLYKWSDYEPPFPKVDKIIPANKLPENIADIPDDILNRAIECEITKKPFRIIKQELEFYRKHNLPIPKRHPDQRHLDRMKLRNPRNLFDRKCDKCGKNIKTTYSPDRKEIVYCEECYIGEVY
ncbi:MAG: hypothetical protein PHE25_06005 [Candidatus Gracilibacteria bacterium]|nr:hypothetical protein [Candidatus Gracilibacteria bacterium]